MLSTRISEVNESSYAKLAQQLRSTKPETVVEAYRQLRITPRGLCLFLC